MNRSVALATCAAPRHADERPLEDALRAAGVRWRWARWDDPAVDWSAFDAVLVRTTWDYHHRVEEFTAWAAAVDARTRLWNPSPVIRWNSHKRYLLQLAAAGVPVVPTALVAHGAPSEEALRSHGGTVVVKPAVSAGSKGTVKGEVTDAAVRDALAAGLAVGDVLVQPFLPEIAVEGERSLVVFDGAPSHQIRKRPAAGDFRVQPQFDAVLEPEDIGEREAVLAETALAAARRLLDLAEDSLLYARVDSVRVDGAPVLMELELIEPDLGFDLVPAAGRRLVDALLGRF